MSSKRDKQKRINCWIPIWLYQAISKLADAEGCDMTEQVTHALRHYTECGKVKERRVM